MTSVSTIEHRGSGPEPVTVDRRAGNSFDFVRFCAASAVLYSHHFDLAGLPEPTVPGYGTDFGELAVEVFFCLSGFLLTLSLERGRGFAFFAAARFMRIMPNLVFALVAASLTTFLWYGNGGHVIDHLAYVRDNLLMFVEGARFDIAGVFGDRVRSSLNDPIWTLPYEVWCYVVLALMFVAGARLARILILIAALAASIAWALSADAEFHIGPLEGFDFLRLASYFLAGAAVAVAWPWMKRNAVAIGAVALISVFVVRATLPDDTVLHALTLAAAVVGLGSSNAMAWFAKGGDASYGIYVFAWPVQQFCQMLIGGFWASMLVAFTITAALGYATWHGFEKRAIAVPQRWVRRQREGTRLEQVTGEMRR
ncbi:acyltransferase [Xanthobacteraceae bacterium Astr-EGSB]|uniref:acyltransferase family protein n=1 Tax=Astrobacterium formosum TaxID=3069710 RepID=UPI0027B8132F|nr:acyltransferase [Xanthobacteraceae bacterium Astr-EGSB]